MKKLLGLVLVVSLATVGQAQGDWRSQLKPTVDAKPQVPQRGRWPAGQAAVVIEGGVAEQWANGLGRARWDAGTRQLTLDFSPEVLAQGDLVRLSIVIFAKGPGKPVGNFGARTSGKVGNLRNVAGGYLVANGALYQAQSGVVGVGQIQNGVLRGSFDIVATVMTKAKGKVGPGDKPVRIRGQFALVAPNP